MLFLQVKAYEKKFETLASNYHANMPPTIDLVTVVEFNIHIVGLC